MTQKKRLRCAAYTRKSTEEGLDQAFNSLDAQREACAAYVQSQKSEGWTLVPTLYDDGGFSGGSMERPALARLMADVRDGKVDIVIVYKVDRLTRSLNDFARIVDVFDAAGASFVSATQQFNTTTSMGRLTLNVLLSFAQFEREVIAERIRDKIAQSKARGIWMGGPVPLGYDVVDRKLVPNPQEAKTVEHIFRRYLAVPSIMVLMEELKTEGIVTKRQTMRDGSVRGGQSFVRGPLHHLIANPMYIGKIRHRDQVYDGQHPPIINQALWDAVQAKRAGAIGTRRAGGNSEHSSLLTGMIRDHVDRPMSPSHAVKQKRRYRYYVSSIASATNEAAIRAPALRLPATELEQAAVDAAAALLADPQTIMVLPQVDAQTTRRRIDAGQALGSAMRGKRKSEVRRTLQALDLAIMVHTDRIDASISRRRLVALLDGTAPIVEDDGHRLPLHIETAPDRHGRNLKLVLRSGEEQKPNVDLELIALIRKAEVARQQLFTQTSATNDRTAERVARLAFLAPDIITAILEGRQPATLTSRRLMKHAAIPLDWKAQREALGFQ
ncbi:MULTISPECIES: recombinase family protein [Sphingobium]|jgi:site-specific DNA recombinase|uniref:Recombinase family protein n=1 Tax=Sphingobium fuliginis (strain ATCC 27551) TaxID=336203 RepID=A0A292ZGP3_SPHSA|nr:MULTISPECIES: recombinase family protein [Sphingobium]QOT70351.1 recombinase family protein [Sphingobium fuliginis]GAY22013.1 site-specific recombinase [Sphingobium fuliginis]